MGKHFDGYLVEGLGGIFFKKDIPIKDFHSALNVFKTESSGGLIHFFHVALGNAFTVVVNSDIKIIQNFGLLGLFFKAGEPIFCE